MVVFISVYHTPVGIQQDIVEETAPSLNFWKKILCIALPIQS